MIETFELINKVTVPYGIGERRTGDAEKNYADVARAKDYLGWEVIFGLREMVKDA